MPERTARRVVVGGRVQGVGFRAACAEQARARGVSGWVRNLPDGRVETWAEGPPQAVIELLEWLAEGPPAARVSDHESTQVAAEGYEEFRITS